MYILYRCQTYFLWIILFIYIYQVAHYLHDSPYSWIIQNLRLLHTLLLKLCESWYKRNAPLLSGRKKLSSSHPPFPSLMGGPLSSLLDIFLYPPPPALCCYPVNWALPLEALIKSPNPLIRRKEEGWRETFPCSSLSMCPMALMLAVPLLVVNVVKNCSRL